MQLRCPDLYPPLRPSSVGVTILLWYERYALFRGPVSRNGTAPLTQIVNLRQFTFERPPLVDSIVPQRGNNTETTRSDTLDLLSHSSSYGISVHGTNYLLTSPDQVPRAGSITRSAVSSSSELP